MRTLRDTISTAIECDMLSQADTTPEPLRKLLERAARVIRTLYVLDCGGHNRSLRHDESCYRVVETVSERDERLIRDERLKDVTVEITQMPWHS